MAFAWFIQISVEKMFKKKSRPTISVRFWMEKSTLAILGSPQAYDANINKIGLEMKKMERGWVERESNYVKDYDPEQ